MSDSKEVDAFDAYQREAKVTMGKHASPYEALCNYAMGLSDEAGEVTGELKKVVFHSKPLDSEKVAEEIGDVLWYMAALCQTMGVSLGAVAHANIQKLRRRHSDGGFKPHDQQVKD